MLSLRTAGSGALDINPEYRGYLSSHCLHALHLNNYSIVVLWYWYDDIPVMEDGIYYAIHKRARLLCITVHRICDVFIAENFSLMCGINRLFW